MAQIKIEDLEESEALDAEAMRAVFGGRAGSNIGARGSHKHAQRARLEESSLIPGLLRVEDLRATR